ncbi:MAG: SDR family NAD(P)-dependent oxidoreductase [Chitinophagales bacterium]|nr:SDR family NAD(P)-dependent oxidoreductase [Chitinophagales bacterium]
MSNQNIAVAYCADNEAVVESLIKPLKTSNFTFTLYPCTRTTSEASLTEQLLGQSSPILLFISDNFLKSAQCMSRALKLLNEKRQVIQPIVINGATKDEATGEMLTVQTDFDRVSDIIQYINYWQDQYLDLRRQKRHVEDTDEEKFNAHLKVMREISSEAGEFLRLLRSMIYLNKYEFQANHYEQFFLFNDAEPQWKQFISQNPGLKPIVEEEQAPPVDIADIPGADMLGLGEEAPQEEPTPTEEPTTAEMPAEDGADLNIVSEPSPLVEVEIPVEEEMNVLSDNDLKEDASVDYPIEEVVEEEGEPETEEEIITDFANIAEDAPEEILELEINTDSEEQADESTEEENETPVAEEIEEEDEGEYEEEEPQAEDPVKLIEEAIEYFNTGQVQEGLAFMAHAVEQNPDDAYLRYHLALFMAQKTENYGQAIEALEPVLEMEPDNEDALFLIGELKELEGDFKGARRHYESLLRLNETYPNAYYRLGMIIASHYENEASLAADCFKEAAEIDADNIDALYQYAILMNDPLNMPKKAAKYLKKIIKSNPDHPFANYDLALIYYQLGKYQKAQQAYAQAIAINPELQTPENDEAFSKIPEIKKGKTKEAHYDSSFTHDALDAMKDNIRQLEELLKHSEEEAYRLQAALEKEAEELSKQPDRPQVDKTVLITGATSGIGRATAQRFASEGYRVIITGRRAERLKEFENELTEEYGAEILPLAFDVRDLNAVKDVVNYLEGKWAQIDILVNNAGKAKGLAPIHEGNIDHWEEMIDTNLKGLLYLTRAISPNMVNRGQGHIINVCSTAGKEVYPNGNVYCATKFAVDALTKAMRMDLHKHNVRVSMVSPAHVDETEFAMVRFDGDSSKASIYNDFKPLSSNDVADTIFFMASQPKHVNILDVVMQGTQQAHSMIIDRSGRERFEEEE